MMSDRAAHVNAHRNTGRRKGPGPGHPTPVQVVSCIPRPPCDHPAQTARQCLLEPHRRCEGPALHRSGRVSLFRNGWASSRALSATRMVRASETGTPTSSHLRGRLLQVTMGMGRAHFRPNASGEPAGTFPVQQRSASRGRTRPVLENTIRMGPVLESGCLSIQEE